MEEEKIYDETPETEQPYEEKTKKSTVKISIIITICIIAAIIGVLAIVLVGGSNGNGPVIAPVLQGDISSTESDRVSGSQGLAYTLSDDRSYYIVSGIGTCTDIDLTIPQTYKRLPVKVIGKKAFYQCKSIESVNIPEGITNIEYGAFSGTNIKSVTIPKSITMIESAAFSGCYFLESVHISDIGNWFNISFESDSSNPLLKIDVLDYYEPVSLYLDGNLITNIVIPDGVTKINSYALMGYEMLESVVIPESVTFIGKCAFYECTSLKSVEFKNPIGWQYNKAKDPTSVFQNASAAAMHLKKKSYGYETFYRK